MHELRILRELEKENLRLKQKYAKLSLDHQILKDIVSKKVVEPDARWEMAKYAIETHQTSDGQVCYSVILSRTAYRYVKKNAYDSEIQTRLSQITEDYTR